MFQITLHNTAIFNYSAGRVDKSKKETNEENYALIARVISRDLFYLERPQAPLPTIEVELQSVINSGIQISIIKSCCAPEYFKIPYGSIILKLAFGHQLKAPFINIPLNIAAYKLHCKVFPKMVVTCAMIDNLINDLLLSLNVHEELNNINGYTECNKQV